jgi:DNA repair exonuclease SbcCD ATPase subunit
MKLSKFWVSGYGTFSKRTEFDLDYKGITTIFGLNKDAGGATYTNASGKSLLFTALPEIAYGSPPSGKDQTKHVKTEIGLEFKGEKDVVTFTKIYGKGKKFEVAKNGKSLSVRTLDYAQKKLQAYLGGSEEDFYTTRYIDNTIPHPLIVGSAAIRQNFFVRMFNLENVDAIRHLLLAELREVQKAASTYKEVKSLFDDVKNKALKQSEIEEKQTKIDKLKGKQEQLLSQINKYQVVRDLTRFEKQNEDLIALFYKSTSLDTFDHDFNKAKSKRKALREQKENSQEWETYKRLHKVYAKEYEPLQEQIEKLVGIDYDLKKVKKRAAQFIEDDKAYTEASRLESNLEIIKPIKVEKLDLDTEELKAKVYLLREELSQANSFKGGKCPTCGSPHKSRGVDEIKKDLKKVKAKLEQCEAYSQYVSDRRAYKGNLDTKANLVAKRNKLLLGITKLRASANALKLIEQLPTKPEQPEGEYVSLKEIELSLDKVDRRLTRFERFKDIIEQLQALSKLTKEQRLAAKELDTFTDDLGKISNRLTGLTAEVTSGREATSQLKKLATRGKVLAKQAEDEPVLKALIDAYSKKGLKKLLIQRYASLLQQQVNKFVRLFFAEDLQFEFKYDSKLDVLVHRKKGKKIITVDVKRLSGAEKRMLTLVLVVASISLLPKNKRANYLILDEPEANLGPEALQTFIRALPILNKVIPHIVVITPRPELSIEGSRVFTVVKRNGVSTLTKGKVGQT